MGPYEKAEILAVQEWLRRSVRVETHVGIRTPRIT